MAEQIKEQFGKELMALMEKFECTTVFFSALYGPQENSDGICLVKLGDDTLSIISILSLLLVNAPDVLEVMMQIMASVYVNHYKEIRDKGENLAKEKESTKSGANLDDFIVKGKIPN